MEMEKDVNLALSIVQSLAGHPYLMVVALICVAVIVVALVSFKMKDILSKLIMFFTSFKSDVTDLRADVKQIRDDQVLSNEARAKQMERLDHLDKRIDGLQANVDQLNSFHSMHCASRGEFQKQRVDLELDKKVG